MKGIIKPGRHALTAAEYVAERNKALLDIEDFVHFAAKYLLERPLPTFKVIEISFHQMRTACLSLPMEERIKSNNWLVLHGYHT